MDINNKEIENYSDMEHSPMSQGSNQSIHSSEDDEERSDTQERAFMSSPSKTPTANNNLSLDFRMQQKDLLERLKEQFTNFPFSNGYPELDLSSQSSTKIHSDSVKNDFALAFSTSNSIKNDLKMSSQPAKRSSNPATPQNWSYEDQYKQVRQLYEINDDPKRKEFLDDLFQFMKERGTPINRLPIMAKSVLDLYELYKLVIARGGLVNVINKKLWQEIIKDLNLPSSITSAAFTLRTQYTKYLYPYECDKYNLSSESELQAAIENNKRDGSRRSTSNFGQFQSQPSQLQIAMSNPLAAANPVPQANAVTNTQQLNDIQVAQQRFMMMMLLYNQLLQQSTT